MRERAKSISATVTRRKVSSRLTVSHSCTFNVFELGIREPAIVAAGDDEGSLMSVELNSTPIVCGDGSRSAGQHLTIRCCLVRDI